MDTYHSSLWNYSIDSRVTHECVALTMVLPLPLLHTGLLPHTISILEQNLPAIFYSECINDENLPLKMELKNTEVAHLFEHIILTYLCQQVQGVTAEISCFTGWTYWNWTQDSTGTFYIEISGNLSLVPDFHHALHQSITLLEKIVSFHAVSATTQKN